MSSSYQDYGQYGTRDFSQYSGNPCRMDTGYDSSQYTTTTTTNDPYYNEGTDSGNYSQHSFGNSGAYADYSTSGGYTNQEQGYDTATYESQRSYEQYSRSSNYDSSQTYSSDSYSNRQYSQRAGYSASGSFETGHYGAEDGSGYQSSGQYNSSSSGYGQTDRSVYGVGSGIEPSADYGYTSQYVSRDDTHSRAHTDQFPGHEASNPYRAGEDYSGGDEYGHYASASSGSTAATGRYAKPQDNSRTYTQYTESSSASYDYASAQGDENSSSWRSNYSQVPDSLTSRQQSSGYGQAPSYQSGVYRKPGFDNSGRSEYEGRNQGSGFAIDCDRDPSYSSLNRDLETCAPSTGSSEVFPDRRSFETSFRGNEERGFVGIGDSRDTFDGYQKNEMYASSQNRTSFQSYDSSRSGDPSARQGRGSYGSNQGRGSYENNQDRNSFGSDQNRGFSSTIRGRGSASFQQNRNSFSGSQGRDSHDYAGQERQSFGRGEGKGFMSQKTGNYYSESEQSRGAFGQNKVSYDNNQDGAMLSDSRGSFVESGQGFQSYGAGGRGSFRSRGGRGGRGNSSREYGSQNNNPGRSSFTSGRSSSETLPKTWSRPQEHFSAERSRPGSEERGGWRGGHSSGPTAGGHGRSGGRHVGGPDRTGARDPDQPGTRGANRPGARGRGGGSSSSDMGFKKPSALKPLMSLAPSPQPPKAGSKIPSGDHEPIARGSHVKAQSTSSSPVNKAKPVTNSAAPKVIDQAITSKKPVAAKVDTTPLSAIEKQAEIALKCAASFLGASSSFQPVAEPAPKAKPAVKTEPKPTPVFAPASAKPAASGTSVAIDVKKEVVEDLKKEDMKVMTDEERAREEEIQRKIKESVVVLKNHSNTTAQDVENLLKAPLTIEVPEHLLERLKSLTSQSYCQLCGMLLNAPLQASQHYQGKNHAKRVRMFVSSNGNLGGGNETATGNEEEGKGFVEISIFDESKKWECCCLCGVGFTSLKQAEQHYSGKNHAKKIRLCEATACLEKAVEDKIVKKGGSNLYECAMCNVMVMSEDQLNTHLRGTKHQNKLKQSQSQAGAGRRGRGGGVGRGRGGSQRGQGRAPFQHQAGRGADCGGRGGHIPSLFDSIIPPPDQRNQSGPPAGGFGGKPRGERGGRGGGGGGGRGWQGPRRGGGREFERDVCVGDFANRPPDMGLPGPRGPPQHGFKRREPFDDFGVSRGKRPRLGY